MGSFELEDLQFCSTLLASPLLMMLLGPPMSASQSISVWHDVVRIQISSDYLEECLVGDSFLNVFGLTKFTVFQLSNTSCIKKVFSRSIGSSFLSYWEFWFVLRRVSVCCCPYVPHSSGLWDVLLGVICWVCHKHLADRHTLL